MTMFLSLKILKWTVKFNRQVLPPENDFRITDEYVYFLQYTLQIITHCLLLENSFSKKKKKTRVEPILISNLNFLVIDVQSSFICFSQKNEFGFLPIGEFMIITFFNTC